MVVPVPEHLGVNAAGQRLAECIEDGAIVRGVRLAVFMGVVCQGMHVAPQHLRRLVAQHAGARLVDEGATPLHVNDKNALPCGRQQQIELLAPGGIGRRWGGEGLRSHLYRAKRQFLMKSGSSRHIHCAGSYIF